MPPRSKPLFYVSSSSAVRPRSSELPQRDRDAAAVRARGRRPRGKPHHRPPGIRQALPSTGSEGLRLAGLLRPAVVLLDLMMPGLDGWELSRQLHKNPATAGAAVIALTAVAIPEDHDRAILAGCDAVLTKPVRPIRIVETVQQFVSPTRIAARV